VAKEDSEEIVVFVGNREEDIARSDADQNGTFSAPYSDFMRAVYFINEVVAPYSHKADGSIITVRIALLKGDHFVINRDYEYKSIMDTTLMNQGFSNYELIISPYYCSLSVQGQESV
jgi:hypothetical protein